MLHTVLTRHEIFRAWHDDFRRGRPTSTRFFAKLAVLAGDALLTIPRSNVSHAKPRATVRYGNAVARIATCRREAKTIRRQWPDLEAEAKTVKSPASFAFSPETKPLRFETSVRLAR